MPPEGPIGAPSLPRVDSRGPYHWSRAQSRLMTALLPERDSGTIRPATEEADQRSDFLKCRRIATLAPLRGRTVPSTGAIEWPYRMANPNLRSRAGRPQTSRPSLMWSALSAPSGKVRDALPTGRRGRSVRVARTDVDADLKARRESRQALGGRPPTWRKWS